MKKHEQMITLPVYDLQFINELLQMTGDEIYRKYGFKRDETITESAYFGCLDEMDIKLVICEEDPPYTEAVLFHAGVEVAHSEPSDHFAGEWILEYEGEEYIVTIKANIKRMENK